MDMHSLGNWAKLTTRTDDCDLRVVSILREMADERGGSRPFQALVSDGNVYWVKSLGNPGSDRALIAEQIVAACGKLITAPVCNVALVRIPEELNGYQLISDYSLRAGIAHASLDVPQAIFDKTHGPAHRARNSNQTRHAYLWALYDWCWGDDLQYLYDPTADMTTFSHDHGYYLPGGPAWSAQTLSDCLDRPHDLGADVDGLDAVALISVADRLESISHDQLRAIIEAVPGSWPVDGRELSALGYFLEKRIQPVAGRLRTLAQTV